MRTKSRKGENIGRCKGTRKGRIRRKAIRMKRAERKNKILEVVNG
jgi:hypothetical protein